MKPDTIRVVDVLEGLRDLKDESIDCILTSPPYWAMRDYGVEPTTWADGSSCAFGLEPTIEEYIEHLAEIGIELKRVLKPSGTFWLNIADCYVGSWGNYAKKGFKKNKAPDPSARPATSKSQSVPPKSLALVPERAALALSKQGWTLRNRIVWHKTNHLPSPAKDRLTPAWEHVLFMVKAREYYFDLDAIRRAPRQLFEVKRADSSRRTKHIRGHRLPPQPGERGAIHPRGCNPGDLWSLSTARSQHLAAFPETLCEIPIKAGCPLGGIVLDPFMGSGTAAVVAKRLGRRFLGFEANAEFAEFARQRIPELSRPKKL